jgi:hypothetical protein
VTHGRVGGTRLAHCNIDHGTQLTILVITPENSLKLPAISEYDHDLLCMISRKLQPNPSYAN